MATKHQVLALYRKHEDWSVCDIAAELDCLDSYVRATIQRADLPPRHRTQKKRSKKAERAMLRRRVERLRRSLAETTTKLALMRAA